MHLRSVASVLSTALIMHMIAMVSTDFENGRKDPLGPYPRIADKKKIEEEIEYAKECRKFITAPKEIFY